MDKKEKGKRQIEPKEEEERMKERTKKNRRREVSVISIGSEHGD